MSTKASNVMANLRILYVGVCGLDDASWILAGWDPKRRRDYPETLFQSWAWSDQSVVEAVRLEPAARVSNTSVGLVYWCFGVLVLQRNTTAAESRRRPE